MVDWARLPKDMLAVISKYLESSLDLVRFRSVCSSWRTAAKAKRLVQSQDFPILSDNGGNLFPDSALSFRLSQRSILSIKPLHDEHADSIGWLVKVKEGYHPRKMTLCNPLTDHYTSYRHFTGVLDMSKFKVRELGREFILHYVNANDGGSMYSPYTGKTVVKYLDSDADSKFVFLTVLDSGKLAVFTSWDQAWTVINNDMPCCYFCDVILFHGCFYAVETNGRTVLVDLSSMKLTLAANPVFGGGNKKFLVESCGEMLLVDMHLGEDFDLTSLWNFDIEDIEDNPLVYYNEITHKLKVFKFVEREKSWVEVMDLGDKMLFLGDYSTFSASASDILPLCGASTAFFHGVVFDWDDLDTMEDQDLGVCEFMSEEIKLVRQHPEYAKLFWPPPSWITSPELESAEVGDDDRLFEEKSLKKRRLGDEDW